MLLMLPTKLLIVPAGPVPGRFGSGRNFKSATERESMREVGMRLFGNGNPVRGSLISGRPAKSPSRWAAVATERVLTRGNLSRSPSKFPKKNVCCRRIGPPNEKPNSLRLKGGLGTDVAKAFLAA